MAASKKLCQWDKAGIESDLAQLAALVGKPRYVCKKCARAARSKKSLCKPVRLP